MDSNTMNLFKKMFDEMPNNIHNLVFYSPRSSKKVLANEFVNKILKKTLTDLIESISVHGLRPHMLAFCSTRKYQFIMFQNV